MDHDSGLSCILCAEADFVSSDRHPRRSSSEAGVASMAEESAGRETPPQQPKSACQTGEEGLMLSSEEFQIITLIVSGYSNQEIGRHFCCSEEMIHRRTLRIIEELGVANKLELVLFALSHRVLSGFPGDTN